MARFMIRLKMGPAPLMPETPRMGRPSKFPTQTATVTSLLNPAVQLSTKAWLVPVLAATGKEKRRAWSSPKAGARAPSSESRSVSRWTASRGRKRREAGGGGTGRSLPAASRIRSTSTSGAEPAAERQPAVGPRQLQQGDEPLPSTSPAP